MSENFFNPHPLSNGNLFKLTYCFVKIEIQVTGIITCPFQINTVPI